MSAYLQKLNEKYVSRTPHMRAIGATVTAVDKGRGTMIDYVYFDGAKFQPTDAEVKKLRPAD